MTELTAPLDLDDAGAQEFLAGIQGNIVKGHGRDFTARVVVRFGDDVGAVRRFLAGFAAEHVSGPLPGPSMAFLNGLDEGEES